MMTIEETLRARPSLIPLKSLAKIIGMHYQTLYDYCREGSIPHLRIGQRIKFDGTDVASWLQDRGIGR